MVLGFVSTLEMMQNTQEWDRDIAQKLDAYMYKALGSIPNIAKKKKISKQNTTFRRMCIGSQQILRHVM